MTAVASDSVALRDLGEADRARLHQWRNSPDVAPYMYSDHLISAEEHDRWFDGIAADPRRRYWVVELNGRPVGLANLADIDLRNRRCAWAYYLADPSVRGRGVGSFVEFQMIEHVFGVMKLAKLWCEVLVSNEAVWSLHLKYGFQREALFRRHVIKGGVAMDVIGLGLLAEEWAALRPTLAARLASRGFSIGTPSP